MLTAITNMRYNNYGLVTALTTLCISTDLMLTTALGGKYYDYLHLTDKNH